MKELTGKRGLDAISWEDGMLVFGTLKSAGRPPAADSFLYVLRDLGGYETAVWGNVMLDHALSQVRAGDYVVIKCCGMAESKKRVDPKTNKPAKYWNFRVAHLESPEAADFEAKRLSLDVIFPPVEEPVQESAPAAVQRSSGPRPRAR